MKAAIFIPCYVDQFYPDVGMSTVRLLEHFGVDHEFPEAQTCCGQPMANTGCTRQTRPMAERFLKIFSGFDYVVCPSGSCVAMVRCHYDEYLAGQPMFDELKRKGLESVLMRLKRLKNEPNPLAERRRKRRK